MSDEMENGGVVESVTGGTATPDAPDWATHPAGPLTGLKEWFDKEIGRLEGLIGERS